MKNVFNSTIKQLNDLISKFDELFNAEIIRVKNEKKPIYKIMNELDSTSIEWTLQYTKLFNIIDNSSNFKIMIDSLKNTLSIIKTELKEMDNKKND
jgi:hypothetical protein